MHVTFSFELVSNSFYYHTESYLLLFMKHMKTNYFHSLNNIVFIVVWNNMGNSYVIITPQQWIKLMKIISCHIAYLIFARKKLIFSLLIWFYFSLWPNLYRFPFPRLVRYAYHRKTSIKFHPQGGILRKRCASCFQKYMEFHNLSVNSYLFDACPYCVFKGLL